MGVRLVEFTGTKELSSGRTLWRFKDNENREVAVFDKTSADRALAFVEAYRTAVQTGGTLPQDLPGQVQEKQSADGRFTNYSWRDPSIPRGGPGGGGKHALVGSVYAALIGAATQAWISKGAEGSFIAFLESGREGMRKLAGELVKDAEALV